ncbi:MAG: hypothetical protein LBI02_00495 [Opitutaceae bacterium]|jgi:bifunctional DNA-binding transcriptional regulator/antitoxin component of YhaV-PrlF toxin-antitoxin module|nr:hypothetical protein [Opitutaceae bacterium]
MIATLTSKNQLTLPKAIAGRFAGVRLFNVGEENGRIILEPLNPVPLGAVRGKLEALGITEDDVKEAVSWARKKQA